MAEQKKHDAEQSAAPEAGQAAEPETVETWYDDEDAPGAGSWAGRLSLCSLKDRMRDDVLRRLPVDVTEHLVNSRKELLRAGIALAESGIRSADETAQRARDLNQAG